MVLTAVLSPAKDKLAVLLLAFGDQPALPLSSLSDFWARLDSVDEVEERPDPLEFARALRESGSDCGCGGTEISSEGAGSSVAGGVESEPSGFALALRESISDCWYEGSEASSVGAEALSGGTEMSSI